MRWLYLSAVALLSACATPPLPVGEQLYVETTPPGAACDLSRGAQRFASVTTPSIMIVPPGIEISMQCRMKGYEDVTVITRPGHLTLDMKRPLERFQPRQEPFQPREEQEI